MRIFTKCFVALRLFMIFKKNFTRASLLHFFYFSVTPFVISALCYVFKTIWRECLVFVIFSVEKFFFILSFYRERHKSSQYLRLKNSKRTSKFQVFFYSTWKTQKLEQTGAPGACYRFLTSIVAKHQKMKGNFQKIYNAGKNWKRDPLGLFNILSVAKHQKIEGGPFDDFFSKKVSRCRKKTERGTL